MIIATYFAYGEKENKSNFRRAVFTADLVDTAENVYTDFAIVFTEVVIRIHIYVLRVILQVFILLSRRGEKMKKRCPKNW